MISHEAYIHRAIQLAQLGRGLVSPNPMVGCVIVHNNRIIGEGWHKSYGEAHAEVNAIDSVADKSLLAESDIYVTLEPCAHRGKTPPCADLLVKHRVRRVIVSTLDTNPLVAGKGIEKLKQANIELILGVLEQQAIELNKRFFCFVEKQRPYIILKWAETSDGFIAQKNYDSKWISHEYSRQLVHKWRSEEDAILVGRNTVAHDNPQLNVRDWSGRNPVRIVIDRYLKLSDKLNVFDASQPTIVYNLLKQEEHTNLTLMRVEEQDFLLHVLKDLHKRKIQSLIVEGGRETLQYFIDQGLWDEARVFTSINTFGKGITAPKFKGNMVASENVMGDIQSTYKNSTV